MSQDHTMKIIGDKNMPMPGDRTTLPVSDRYVSLADVLLILNGHIEAAVMCDNERGAGSLRAVRAAIVERYGKP